jgi:nucleotide-binding universal stress UspA family protein
MKLIVACDGRDTEPFLAALSEITHLADAEVYFVHVVDRASEERWEHATEHHWLRRRPGPRERSSFAEPAAHSSQEILQEALALSLEWPVTLRTIRELRGNPERELVRLCLELDADLIALAQHRIELGPHALGHCARFVADHAPCPVLMVRDAVVRTGAAALLARKLEPRRPGRS